MAAQYGYIRVSGADQNEARQVIAMPEGTFYAKAVRLERENTI